MMSAFELNWDHIVVMVHIGCLLDIRNIPIDDCLQPLRLSDNDDDRRYLAAELMAQNRTSVAYLYRLPVSPAHDVPSMRTPPFSLNGIADLAQAAQWVRCYQNQSCEDPDWNTTFAYHYCQALLRTILSKIIDAHDTTWAHQGPSLT